MYKTKTLNTATKGGAYTAVTNLLQRIEIKKTNTSYECLEVEYHKKSSNEALRQDEKLESRKKRGRRIQIEAAKE